MERPPQYPPAVNHQNSKAEIVAAVVVVVVVVAVAVAVAAVAMVVVVVVVVAMAAVVVVGLAWVGVPTFFHTEKSDVAVAAAVAVCTVLAEQTCRGRCKEVCLRLQILTA